MGINESVRVDDLCVVMGINESVGVDDLCVCMYVLCVILDERRVSCPKLRKGRQKKEAERIRRVKGTVKIIKIHIYIYINYNVPW